MLFMAGACGMVACRDSPLPGKAPASAPVADARSDTAVPAAGSQATGRATVAIEITAVVGGKETSAQGLGECNHTVDASIYEVPAALWRAGYQGADGAGVQDLNLTLWQPKSGGDQFSVALRVGGEIHQIATVKGGTLVGTGTATVRPDGGAGTFVVEGKDEGGVTLHLTVRCSRFTEPVAEGG
jgi:hypothetical protein